MREGRACRTVVPQRDTRPPTRTGWRSAFRRGQPWIAAALLAGGLALTGPAGVAALGATPPPSLQKALEQLVIPPEWFATTALHWDTNKPWKDARLEVRRLLGLEGDSIREAVKLTWLYSQKGDIGNGHELPMYLFMSGNYAWAVREYPPHLKTVEGKGATHEYMCYASCLEHFGEYDKALEVVNHALKDLPPAPWRISSRAGIENHLGDLYAKMGHLPQAREHYAEAIRLYPTSDQPNGRHLLIRQVGRVQTKLKLLALEMLQNTPLRDGTYVGKSLGYADAKDMETTVTIRGGKITDVQVKHAEKIDLGATSIIPKRIVAQQSLKVDGITGATVTCQAIVDGAFQALKQAGLQ
jgi:uncharacterized protein with FMN-binding domain